MGKTTHGLTKHPLYLTWCNMKKRCYYVKDKSYHRYGGRGIKVCPKWRNSFKDFYDWCMANGWKKGLELDRRDNDGHYRTKNCRWITHKDNLSNRAISKSPITYMGLTLSIQDWCTCLGIKEHTVRERMYRNLPIFQVLHVGRLPNRKRSEFKIND